MMTDTIKSQNSCPQKHCQSGQFSHTKTESHDRDPDFSERPVLYTGVLWIGIMRKFLVPRPVPDSRPCCPRQARDDTDVVLATPTNTSSERYNVQPSTHAYHKPHECREQELLRIPEKQDRKHSSLAALVYQIQEASELLKSEVRQFSEELTVLVQDGKASTSEVLHTLREDEAVAGRYSAITISSLLGYLAGMRRGVAVRLVYAATGVAASATLCYPEEARHHNDHALALLRQGVLLAVHKLKNGPLKTLVSKDSVDQETTNNFNKNANIVPKPCFQPSQETETTLKANNDNDDSQEKSFSGVELEKKLSLNSKYKTLQKNISSQEQQEMPTDGSTLHCYAHEGRLSRECQRDITRTAPYYPALPDPPNVLEPDYFQSSNTVHAYQNVPNTKLDDSIKTDFREEAILHHKSLNDTQSSLKVNTSERKTSKAKNSNSTEINDVKSALEPTQKVVPDSSKNETRYEGQNYPLNKKLSRYYVEKKDFTLTSSPDEYDDIISKNQTKESN